MSYRAYCCPYCASTNLKRNPPFTPDGIAIDVVADFVCFDCGRSFSEFEVELKTIREDQQ